MLLHLATRTNDHIYRWTDQKHLKTPTVNYVIKKEDITHLFISWKHFQKYYKCVTQKRTYTFTTTSQLAHSATSFYHRKLRNLL